MPRKLDRRQALENQAFLRALRRTGNAREAARALGIHRATLTRRRAAHPDFAAEWDAALAIAHARLNAGGQGASAEPQIVRLANGRLQLRDPATPRLTRADEQAFLAALAATANIRLSARAAGFSHSAFYHRRKLSPAFAREMRLALQVGYDRIEAELLAGFDPQSHRDDGWRHNEFPPIPPMSVGAALQLLHLHARQARLWAERPDRRRRRGESPAAHSARLAAKWRAEKAWDREGYEVARAADGAPVPPALEPPAPILPALDQVTGWSKAKGNPPHNPDLPLFGGWRLGDRKDN